MSKLALKQLDWRVMMLLSAAASFPFVILIGLGPLTGMDTAKPAVGYAGLFACIAGLGASAATLGFNRALQTGGPANVVVPLTSQYVLVIVLFSTIFLKEPLTWQRVVGIIAAVVAIVFLSL